MGRLNGGQRSKNTNCIRLPLLLIVEPAFQVTLNWDAPEETGKCAVEGYAVNVVRLSPETRTMLQPRVVRSYDHEVVIEGLQNCETFRFMVIEPVCLPSAIFLRDIWARQPSLWEYGPGSS